MHFLIGASSRLERPQRLPTALALVAGAGLLLPPRAEAAEPRPMMPTGIVAIGPGGAAPLALDVALGPGGTLAGQVLTADGTPLVGAPLTVREGSRQVASTTTDTNGRFTVSGLGSGAFEAALGRCRLHLPTVVASNRPAGRAAANCCSLRAARRPRPIRSGSRARQLAQGSAPLAGGHRRDHRRAHRIGAGAEGKIAGQLKAQPGTVGLSQFCAVRGAKWDCPPLRDRSRMRLNVARERLFPGRGQGLLAGAVPSRDRLWK